MRAVCFTGVGRVAVDTTPRPRLEEPNDAVVRVVAAGLCGSDLHLLHGTRPCDAGTVFGHEFVGLVDQCGPAVRSFSPGMLVMAPFSTNCGECDACRTGVSARCSRGQLFGFRQGGNGLQGTQAEYVRVPLADATLLAVPPDLHPEEALLVGDIWSTASFAAANAGLAGPGDSPVSSLTAALEGRSPLPPNNGLLRPCIYAVVGCGPVGLLTTIAATHLLAMRGSAPNALGGHVLFAIDSVPERLAAAKNCGAIPIAAGDATAVSASMRAALEGMGLLGPSGVAAADAVMECVGAASAIELAFTLLRPGGVLSSVGIPAAPFPFSPAQAYDKNLTYRIGRCPARSIMPLSLELLRRVKQCGVDPRGLVVSHRFSLEGAVEAYRLFDSRLAGCTKAVLYPRADELERYGGAK